MSIFKFNIEITFNELVSLSCTIILSSSSLHNDPCHPQNVSSKYLIHLILLISFKSQNLVPSFPEEIKIFLSSNNNIEYTSFECVNI